jgi:hypothetical protein
MNEAVEPITFDSRDWIGSIAPGYEWYYADYMLLLTLGGIPWQVEHEFGPRGEFCHLGKSNVQLSVRPQW